MRACVRACVPAAVAVAAAAAAWPGLPGLPTCLPDRPASLCARACLAPLRGLAPASIALAHRPCARPQSALVSEEISENAISRSDNLSRMLPAEAMLACSDDPALQMLFTARRAEKSLLSCHLRVISRMACGDATGTLHRL
eukprot:COSAG01_NODE_8201_length_2877_cov_66.935565_3_plen_141_part_00